MAAVDNPVVVAPAQGPRFDKAKIATFLRAPASDQDALEEISEVAADIIEARTSRSIITQVFAWYLDAFTCGRGPTDDFWFSASPGGERADPALRLPVGPVKSVTAIKYWDVQLAPQTLATNLYEVDLVGGRVAPSAAAGTWPQTGPRMNAVEITFAAGYGNSEAEIPPRLRHAVYMLTGFFYENREAYQAMSLQEAPGGLVSLIDSFILRPL